MRLLSLIVAFLASGALAAYVLTCSVNDAPPAPVHPIVGKWQKTVIAGRPVEPLLVATTEYTIDGNVVLESTDPKNGYRYEKGTYTIAGNKVSQVFPQRCANRQHVLYTIVSLTDTGLTALGDEADAPSEICVCLKLPCGR